jgi:5-methylcytosine-specific restriction endonuclease McrA
MPLQNRCLRGHLHKSIKESTMCNHKKYICTGFEHRGICFWCGSPLINQIQDNYCSRNCFTEYHRHFHYRASYSWAYARANHECQLCGNKLALEVHHISPVNGGERLVSTLNCPCNLIVLRHKCHLLF